MNWRSNICKIYFFVLMFFSFSFFSTGIYFCVFNLCYFIEWEVLMLNSSSEVMTFLFDWMSLMFMGLALFISSMVIFYSNDYMSGDHFTVRFILLVIMFLMSMMLLIINPNMISILLSWDGLGLISYL